jgi:hypothetical protein
MLNRDIKAALDRHWAASEAGDDDAEDEIYHEDAVLEYPQSGERIRGRVAIRTTRGLLPNKHFTIRRILGRGDLWITEYVISYDGKPLSLPKNQVRTKERCSPPRCGTDAIFPAL